MFNGKTIALTRWVFFGKEMSLLSNMLSSFGHSFSSKEQTSFNFMIAVTICSDFQFSSVQSLSRDFGAPQNKVSCVSIVFPSICHEVMGLNAMIFVFWMLSFKPTFSLPFFTFIKRLFSSCFSAIRVILSAYLKLLIFQPAILIPACASSSPAFLMMYSA